ncbi:MAG: phage major capsid protein [Promethearchaeota archaeon]
MRSLNPESVSKVDEKRAKMLREAMRLVSNDFRTPTIDLGAAIRMVLLQDQEFFDEVSYYDNEKFQDAVENRNSKSPMRYAYERMAKVSKDGKSRFQRANEIDADAGNADSDLSELFVEKTIKKRVETPSKLLQMLDNKNQVAKDGKYPKSSNIAKCAFAAKSDDLTDLTDTIDDGLDRTAIEPEKFGGTMFFEQEAYTKLNAAHVQQLIDDLSIAYNRGMIDQIVNGNGTPPNSTGLATNATAIAYDGNVTQTLLKMIAAVADVSKGGSKELFILTNTAGYITMEGEKFINKSHDDLIEILGTDNFLRRLPVVEENVIVTSGSSPNVAAPLYVGKRGDYLRVTNTQPKIEIDKFSDFEAGGERVRIMGFWQGKPHFNDSFAKTTIPSVY